MYFIIVSDKISCSKKERVRVQNDNHCNTNLDSKQKPIIIVSVADAGEFFIRGVFRSPGSPLVPYTEKILLKLVISYH